MKTLLQDLLEYVSVPTCRQLAILDYFSDAAERALGPCGLCDRCVLPCSSRHTERGRGLCEGGLNGGLLVHGAIRRDRIVDLLRGSRSKALLAYGVEACPSYGAYQTWSKSAMTRLVKELIHSGYLHVEGLEYPTLDVTRLGQEILRGNRRALAEKYWAHPTNEAPSLHHGQMDEVHGLFRILPSRPAAFRTSSPSAPGTG